jgi:hypothetical protein
MGADPRATARRARYRKWFWVGNYPLLVGLYVWAYGLTLDPVGIFVGYVALLSVQALVEGAAGVEQSAEGRVPDDG